MKTYRNRPVQRTGDRHQTCGRILKLVRTARHELGFVGSGGCRSCQARANSDGVFIPRAECGYREHLRRIGPDW